MGFLEEFKKKTKELNDHSNTQKTEPVSKTESVSKSLERSNKKAKVVIEKLLFDDEKLLNFYGTEFGYTGVTDKRVLIGTNFSSDTKPKKVISFIPLNKITSIGYEYEWGVVLKDYKVNVNVSSNTYTVVFFTESDAISFHKIISQKLI